MTLTKTQQIEFLAFLAAVIVVILVYQRVREETPRTQPLTHMRGMKVASPVRRGGAAADPLAVVLDRRSEKYPGVVVDIFRMNVLAPVVKHQPVIVAEPVAAVSVPTIMVAVKTPEEIAADAARSDLSTFRFLGYLTDKDSSLFLSKDGELFIVKSGDTVLKNYQVKTVGKDQVVLYDTVTKVEVRIELTGSGAK